MELAVKEAASKQELHLETAIFGCLTSIPPQAHHLFACGHAEDPFFTVTFEGGQEGGFFPGLFATLM